MNVVEELAADALAEYDARLADNPDDVEALAGRARTLRAAGRPREALMGLLRVLSLRPSDVPARTEMGLALAALGRRDEAKSVFALLVREPAAPGEAWHGLAGLLRAEGHEAAAMACLRRAAAVSPGLVAARRELADMTARTDLAAAADQFHDILALDPGNPAAHAGLGQSLIGLGRLAEAEDQLERALVMDDENLVARLGRARLRLLEGDFQSAWDDLEWRWQIPGQPRPEMPWEAWDGGPLDGRVILLWAEQGLDDVVQMVRYLPQVAAMGGKVLLSVPQPLVPLLTGMEGASWVVASGSPVPRGVRVDCHASLLELPRLFGTTLSTIPRAIPYLTVDQKRRRPLAAPPSVHLKVGLTWASGRLDWSAPFTQAMQLLRLPDVAFYSLQLGERARDGLELAHPALLTDLSSTIGDFADFAARLEELDLLVTVDGAAAHIAGAMGKDVLLMLPFTPDWRWMLDRADTPWYPTVHLFRQDRPGDWTPVITRVLAEIEARAAAAAGRRAEGNRAHSGPKAAMRALLAGHLAAGDLFVDVGAGDGTFALDAAAHPSGDVRVLAIEAKRQDAEILADTIAISGAEDIVEVIAEPVAGRSMPAVVARVPRQGRTVFPLPDWVEARTHTVAVDSLLSDRPELADRRLVVRIGTRTSEDAVLDGLWEALATQRAAVVLFEHRDGAAAAGMLTDAGYTLWRFPTELAGGPVKAFSGQPGPVVALATGVAPNAVYGDLDDPTSIAALAKAKDEAIALAAEGTKAMMAGDPAEAGRLLGRAATVDPTNVQANTNLAVLLRRAGRSDAAAICSHRAVALGAGAGVRANLAAVLRDLGHLESAERFFLDAIAADPDNPAFLFGFATLERLRGRAREALALIERAHELAPKAVPPGHLAYALLKAGNLARGMAELAGRDKRHLTPPPAGTAEWDGARLDARTILVRDEGDAIDTVMLARFIPQVARQGGLVTVECVPEAARLIGTLPGVEAVVPRGGALPETDLYVDLLDVPRIIGTTSRTTPPRDVPYLHLPEGVSPRMAPADGRLRVGVVWGGRERDPRAPLAKLLPMASAPGVQLVSLQRGPAAADLDRTGARALVEDLGATCEDLADIAAVIAGLDLVVGVDSPEIHVAGAMGRPAWVLLPIGNDWRWVEGRDDAVWYPTMRVFRQSQDSTWTRAITRVAEGIAAMAAAKRGR